MTYFKLLERSEKRKEEEKRKMEPPKKPMIAICIPHKEFFLASFITDTLVPLVKPTVDNWCNKSLITKAGHNVDVQRNWLGKEALERGASHLLFLDSDMVFEGMEPMQGVKMLYEMDVPIASGIARLRGPLDNDKHTFPYAMFFEDPPNSGKLKSPTEKYLEDNPGSVVSPDAVGMFCCLIKREVLEELPAPWFKFQFEFDTLTGEDFYFCSAARKAGYKISVNPEVKLTHMGTFGIASNMEIKTID